jgi:Flp pilus assembly protein TadD
MALRASIETVRLGKARLRHRQAFQHAGKRLAGDGIDRHRTRGGAVSQEIVKQGGATIGWWGLLAKRGFNRPLGLTIYHRQGQCRCNRSDAWSNTGNRRGAGGMSVEMSRKAGVGMGKLALGAAIMLALAGCMGRGAGDITGSIGSSASQMSDADWRRQSAALQRAYEQNPTDRSAILNHARALRATGQTAQAVAVLQAGVLRHTNDMEMMGAFGRALMDAGDLKRADEVFSRAHTPERPDWRILSAQGAVADQLGDHARAQALYQTALRIAPGEPTILSNLGLSYALSKRLPEAERVLTEAARHPRADARVRQNLMLVYGLQGRFGEAEKLAKADLGPEEGARQVAQLRRMVSQQNSWDMLRRDGGRNAGRAPATSRPAQGRSAPAPAPAEDG